MRKTLLRLSVISLIFMFLDIFAGSVVRVSDSGMGCPDWPKCFGYYVPPTSVETLTWQPNHSFAEGNMIIKDKQLLVAKSDNKSGEVFNEIHWRPYTKVDYAHFNAAHTWTEYITRLIGALSGIPVILLYIVSIFYFKRDPQVTLLSLIGVLLFGLEAWLTKGGSDGMLISHQIIYQMFIAITLVLLYSYLIVRLSPPTLNFKAIRDRGLVIWGVVTGGLFLIQIYLGTMVREEVDTIGKSNLLNYEDWMSHLSVVFKIHRSFSFVILLIGAIFAVKVIRTRTISTLPRVLLVMLFLEALLGIGLTYFDLPELVQPLHLIVGIADITLLFTIVLIYLRKTKKNLTVTVPI